MTPDEQILLQNYEAALGEIRSLNEKLDVSDRANGQMLGEIKRLSAQITALTDWRPSETAPSDGQQVQVFGGRYQEVRVIPADGEWWKLRNTPNGSKMSPTVWLPLAPPPATEKGDQLSEDEDDE